jgi:hypothetical protein
MSRLWPSLLGAAKIVQPETILLRLQGVLALEIAKEGRAAKDRSWPA